MVFLMAEIELRVCSTTPVLVDVSEESATKFTSYRDCDKLLCSHVYLRFCPDCPQYQCRKRSV